VENMNKKYVLFVASAVLAVDSHADAEIQQLEGGLLARKGCRVLTTLRSVMCNDSTMLVV
jgi:hypothetical protein